MHNHSRNLDVVLRHQGTSIWRAVIGGTTTAVCYTNNINIAATAAADTATSVAGNAVVEGWIPPNAHVQVRGQVACLGGDLVRNFVTSVL